MARIDIPDGPGGDEAMVWTMRPEMGAAIGRLVDSAYHQSILPAREREAARMRIAQLNECVICQRYRAASFSQEGCTPELYAHVAEYRERAEYTTREKLAIEYAERFATDHTGIDDELFGRLREQYSDEEIVDLSICLAAFLGLGRLLRSLGIEGNRVVAE